MACVLTGDPVGCKAVDDHAGNPATLVRRRPLAPKLGEWQQDLSMSPLPFLVLAQQPSETQAGEVEVLSNRLTC